MIRAAWWTCACALLAVASARIYGRCELARDLTSLGVQRDQLSTWVCIAYHESRFDTEARNGYSGDHGLFQISELYWCGPGKACGLPCSALRDEDISNDFECALRIHEEHTRIQGDGFLAWVVYPQHCKHNTKKYIVDCDSHLKNATVRAPNRSRKLINPYLGKTTFENNPNIDNLRPPYLAVNELIRGGYGKMIADNDQKDTPFNWLNFKVANIDELKLPVFNEKTYELPKPPITIPTRLITTQTTTSTTPKTITTTAYPPIKVWRRIETNQFRKKKKPTPAKWLELGKPSIPADTVLQELTTVKPPTGAAAVTSTISTSPGTVRTALSTHAAVKTTTSKPTSVTSSIFRFTANKLSPNNFTRNTVGPSTGRSASIATTTAKPIVKVVKSPSGSTFTTYAPFIFTTARPVTRTTTDKPVTNLVTFPTSTAAATTIRPVTFTWNHNRVIPTVSTGKVTKAELETFEKSTFQTTTSTWKPLIYIDNNQRKTFNFSQSTTAKLTSSTSTSTTSLGLLDSSKSPKSSRTLRLSSHGTSTTLVANRSFSSTSKPFAPRTNKFTTTASPITNVTPITPTTTSRQSIFDLYLSPVQWPKPRTYKFPGIGNGAHKLKIFSGGTTPVPDPIRSTPRLSPTRHCSPNALRQLKVEDTLN